MKNLINILLLLISTSIFSQESKVDSISIYLPNTNKLLKTVSNPKVFVKTLDSLSSTHKVDSFTLVSFVKGQDPVVGVITKKPLPSLKKEQK